VRERRACDRLARELIDKLPWDGAAPAGPAPSRCSTSEELMGIVPADEREPYDVREVIARLVDGSDFLEFKARLRQRHGLRPRAADGPCGGIIGNNGPIQPAGSHQGRAVHPAVRPERHAAGLPAEHHRLHGRLGRRARRRHQARLAR
jgi:acetyl-CoA carboxylase carboxyltransferase component